MTNIAKIKQLREQSGASIALCNKAIIEAKGDIKKAQQLLTKWGAELAVKKQDKSTNEGIVASYIHHNQRWGAMVVLQCETDFVARNADFAKLGREIAMQIASQQPKTTEELLKQAYIRDPEKSIQKLLEEYIAKLGENIKIGEFVRLEI